MKELHPGTPLDSQPKYAFWNNISNTFGFVIATVFVGGIAYFLPERLVQVGKYLWTYFQL